MTDDDSTRGFSLLEFDDPEGGLLAYAMSAGALTEGEMAPIWKRFDDAKAKGTKLRLFAEMHGMPNVEPGFVWDKLKRIGTIMGTVERMAIVGDAGWLELYAKVIDPLTKPDVRHFGTAERDAALDWLRE